MVERTNERDSGVEGSDGESDDSRDTAAGERDASRLVAVETAVTPGEHVMFAGADIAAGERALGPGTRLTAREVGLLSALGVAEVPVRARPRVGIISTGDELVRPGDDLDTDAGQIYDVNTYAVAAGIEAAGGEPVVYPHVADTRAAMAETLTEAATECDLVLTSGSTSASAVDVVYRVVEERGELLLHGVAIKPGKPMLVGRIDGTAYVGLPGYPVSSLSIFRTFVAPVVREAAGLPPAEAASVTGSMALEERYEAGRRRLLPVGLVSTGDGTGGANDAHRGAGEADSQRGGASEPESGAGSSAGRAGDLLVYPVDKGSGATTSLTEADGIVDVPAETNYLAAGQRVEVDLFSPGVRPPALLGVGEDDPALSRLLDRLDRPRYLARGTRPGLRWLRDGVPDAVVAAGPLDESVDAPRLGAWEREWGLVVPADNPADVTGLADLVERDLSFVNRGTDSGLRTSLSNSLAELADERGVDRRDVTGAVRGYDLTRRAFESPARAVAAGDADAGLGLRATAAKLGLGFVPVGTQTVRVLANPDRTGKTGVDRLATGLDDLGEVLSGLDGFDVAD